MTLPASLTLTESRLGFVVQAQTRAFRNWPFYARTILPHLDFAQLSTVFSGPTPGNLMYVRQGGGLYMSSDRTDGDLYLRPIYAGGGYPVNLSTLPSGQYGFPSIMAPASMPWALRARAALYPQDIAGPGNPGAIVVCGWTGSTNTGQSRYDGGGPSSPGRGVNGGSVAIVYSNGSLKAQLKDATPHTGTYAIPFTSDGKLHVFDLWFDLQFLYAAVDEGAPVQLTPSMFGAPQSMSFPFFGTGAGGTDTAVGGWGMDMHEFSFAAPTLRV